MLKRVNVDSSPRLPFFGRRDIVRAALIGLGLSASAKFGLSSVAKTAANGDASLNPHELALLAAVIDTLIPRTTTPGALDVGVINFIHFVFRRGMDSHAQQAFREGVHALRIDSQSQYPSGLDGATPTQRLAYVQTVDSGLFSAGSPQAKTPLLEIYAVIKRLTVIGYFTAEVAAHQTLEVQLYPGPFVGEKPVTEHTRAFYEDSFGVPLERPPGYMMVHG
jgi:hypothetical protein